MVNFRYYVIYILATLIRFFPFPTKTGIRQIGSPDADSPVLVTGNYILTVELLKKELQGLNLFLLVANSRGINIWCAATGGHFTNHDIVSILKTSGIDQLVNHRRYILPQLAATGIEPKIIRKKTGWHGTWGPIRAADVKEYLTDKDTSGSIRTVDFPLKDRIDMAIAWAFLMSAIFALSLAFFSINAMIIAIILCWYIALVMFITFPLFEPWYQEAKEGDTPSVKTRIIYPLVIAITGIPVYIILINYLSISPVFYTIMPILGGIIILMVSMDLKGSTPVFKSDMIEDRIFDIKLYEERCHGAADCVTVCPKNCFVFDDERRKVSIPRPELCVQCGACVVQCPFDALYLQNKEGDILGPDILREYKLNLMGKRAIEK